MESVGYLFMISMITGVVGDFCTFSFVESYYTLSNRVMYRTKYDFVYCSSGCCGSSKEQYCCSSNTVQQRSASTGEIIGLTVGGLAAFVVLLLLCILCCFITKKSKPRSQVAGHGRIGHYVPAGSNMWATQTRGPVNIATFEQHQNEFLYPVDSLNGIYNPTHAFNPFEFPPSYDEATSSSFGKQETETECNGATALPSYSQSVEGAEARAPLVMVGAAATNSPTTPAAVSELQCNDSVRRRSVTTEISEDRSLRMPDNMADQISYSRSRITDSALPEVRVNRSPRTSEIVTDIQESSSTLSPDEVHDSGNYGIDESDSSPVFRSTSV